MVVAISWALPLVALSAMVPSIVWAEQAAPLFDLQTALIKGSDVTVTVADYRQALDALLPEQKRAIENDPEQGQQLLFEIYTERMLEREARRRGLDRQADVQARLAQAPRKILVNAIVEEERAALPHPDFTALAEEYYLTHKQKYVQPERIQVAHILWSLKCDCEDSNGAKRAQAETVLKELRASADFAEFAKQYSDDKASAAKGGDLGQWFVRDGKLIKEFEDIAFALPAPGALSDVVKTEYGYHIIKLIAREPAGTQSFEQVKGQIVEELSKKYRSSAQKAFVGQYYPTAEQFDRAAIDAVLSVPSAQSLK